MEEFARRLGDHLSQAFDRQLMEVALDITIGEDDKFYLMEMDNHPGMAKPGMEGLKLFDNIFSPSGKPEEIYNRYLKPHGESLAKFLLHQAARLEGKV